MFTESHEDSVAHYMTHTGAGAVDRCGRACHVTFTHLDTLRGLSYIKHHKYIWQLFTKWSSFSFSFQGLSPRWPCARQEALG